MKSVGGGGPKATLSLAQAQEAPEAVPLHEPPSPPLTTNSGLMEPDGHGPQGDPVSAGAKSLPESCPETSSGSMSPTGYCEFPLTTADRESVQADLDQQRELLERHSNTEPLTGMVDGWSKRYWSYAHEIARLERMLKYG